MHPAKTQFPSAFLWGTASSAYQTEGGNTRNDWYHYEQAEKRRPLGQRRLTGSAGAATRQWQLFAHDYAMAQEMGVQVHRLSIEWSRVFPNPSQPDVEALETYRKQLIDLHDRGIRTMVCLHHFTIPIWVLNQGGFLNPDYLLARFQEYVDLVVPYLAGEVDYWLPINEPNIVPSASFLIGMFPPFQKNLFRYLRVYRLMISMHGVAFHAIRKTGRDTPVGVAFAYMHFQPLNPRNPWQQVLSKLADRWANRIFFEAVVNGRWAFPLGWGQAAPHLKGTLDFTGLNYYTTLYFRNTGAVPYRDGDTATDMGWVVYPEGIRQVLHQVHQITGKPVLVTENGTSTRDEGFRIRYLQTHLEKIHQAMQEGVPVLGYMAWSLTDNYEWQHAYSKHFGLVAVDSATGQRTLKKSGLWYQQVIRNQGF